MKYFSLFLIIVSFQLSPVTDYEKQYLKKYPAPQHIKDILNKATSDGILNYDDLTSLTNRVFRLKKCPTIFVKTDLFRLDGAHILQTAMTKHNITLGMIPNKYAYENINVWVVAEEVTNIVDGSFTLEQIMQLWKLCRKTKYVDAHDGNVKKLSNGQFAIIDTGPEGFCTTKDGRIDALYRMYYTLPLTNEAKNYVDKEIKMEVGRNEVDEWFDDHYNEHSYLSHEQNRLSIEQLQKQTLASFFGSIADSITSFFRRA